MNKLRIAGAALNQIPFDWNNNLTNIRHALSEARNVGVDILCLPELCITGYGCEDQFLSDWLWQRAFSLLPEIARETAGMLVTVGLPVRHNATLYNCSCVVIDSEIKGLVAKQFMANDGVHYEPRWFTPWQRGEVSTIQMEGQSIPIGDLIFEYNGISVGMEICEDAWRGEHRPAGSLAARGVDLIINPSASHFAFGKSKLREQIAIDASRTYNLVYLYANLLGNEAGRMIYDGEIFISGQGNIYAYNQRLSFQNVNLLYKDIDFDNLDSTETKTIDPEDKDEIFTQAVSLALFDYLRKSHSKGFVLSLSGGADSGSCAILVAEMVKRGINELGVSLFLNKMGRTDLLKEAEKRGEGEVEKFIVENILYCAYQATVNSSRETFEAASQLAAECGATFFSWRIDEEVDTYTRKMENAIGRKLTWEQDDIALQNIQARARSPIIWMLANIKNALLITTSNRSEGDVGYATMDGDTSGSIAPIAAVDKHFILQWLRWAEETLGYVSLRNINSLRPSAELRPLERTQTDEADLMPYPVIVEIERLAIRDRKSPLEVYQKLKAKLNVAPAELVSYIVKFYTLWTRNQWKRERIAPSFHLDDFNVDPRTWCRFPILSSGFSDELEQLKRNL